MAQMKVECGISNSFNQNYFVFVTLMLRDFIVKILKSLFDLTEQRSQLFRLLLNTN